MPRKYTAACCLTRGRPSDEVANRVLQKWRKSHLECLLVLDQFEENTILKYAAAQRDTSNPRFVCKCLRRLDQYPCQPFMKTRRDHRNGYTELQVGK